MDLRALLIEEFERRRRRNPRYSMRAFAQNLGASHTSLLRLLRQKKRLTRRTALALGRRLGLGPAEISAAIQHEAVETVLGLVGHKEFRPDCRWLAVHSGFPLDEVNVALHALIHARRLTLTGARRWRQEPH